MASRRAMLAMSFMSAPNWPAVVGAISSMSWQIFCRTSFSSSSPGKQTPCVTLLAQRRSGAEAGVSPKESTPRRVGCDKKWLPERKGVEFRK